jgi:hypothetical protein
MSVNEEEIQKFIERNFRLPQQAKSLSLGLLSTNSDEISYEAALKIVL